MTSLKAEICKGFTWGDEHNVKKEGSNRKEEGGGVIPLPTMSNVYKTYSRNLGQRSILARKGNFF